MLRKIFGATKDEVEVTGDQSSLHNEKIYILYSSPNFWGDQIAKDGMGGSFGTYGGQKGCVQVLVGKSRGKR